MKTEKQKISPELAMRNLNRAMIGLGLTYIDCLEILQYEEDCETAYWSYNSETKKEKIVVGPDLAVLSTELIQIVLRHEILHKVTYNSFSQRFPNIQLANIVFDTCINQLIYQSFPEDMKKLASIVYNLDSQKTILCLPNPNSNPELIPENLVSLWKFIWRKNEFGQHNYVSATSLYYKLEESFSSLKIPANGSPLLSCGGGCGNKEHHSNNRDFKDSINLPSLEKVVQSCFNGLNPVLVNAELSDYSIIPLDLNLKGMKQFLNRIMAAKIASKVINDLDDKSKNTEKFLPYPFFPTRRGLVYLLSGVSYTMGMYHNKFFDITNVRLALGIYLDLSGSMEDYFPYIPIIVDHLKSYPLKMMGFTDRVFEIEVSDISKGKIKGGGNTDFNPIFEDLLLDKNLHAGLIITDGAANLSIDNIKKFKNSGKKLYQILFAKKSYGPISKIANAEYIFNFIK